MYISARQNFEDAANAENIPPNTAFKILCKYHITGTTHNIVCSGYLTKTTDKKKYKIIWDATKSRRKTFKDLTNDLTFNCLVSTIWKVLNHYGYTLYLTQVTECQIQSGVQRKRPYNIQKMQVY